MERLPLLYLLGLPLWAATFLGYGALVVGPFHLQWSDRLERVLLSTITGAGFFCLVVSIVGLGGWLYSPVLWLILLVGVALSVWQFRTYLKATTLAQEVRQARRAIASYLAGLACWQKLVLVLLLLTIASNLVIALGPPIEGDALSQYLAVPKVFVREGRIFFAFPASQPISVWSVFGTVTPLSLQMLSAAGLATVGESFALLGNRLVGLLLLLLIGQFARRLGFPAAALLAGATFYMTGLSNYQGHTAKVEIGAGLFEVGAVYALWVWYSTREKTRNSADGSGWLYLSGLLLGFAISVRQSGFYTALLMTMFLIGCTLFLRPRRPRLAQFLVWVFLAVSAGAIWLVAAYVYTGNPFYPALGQVFGTSWPFGPTGQILPPGINSGLGGMAQMFVALSLGPVTGFGLVESIGPVFIVLAPAVIYTAYRLRHHGYVLLVVYVLAYYLLWFQFYAITRLMTAAVAVAAVLTGIAFVYTVERGPRLPRVMLRSVLVGAFILNLGLNLIIARHYLPHALGLESRQAFLSRMFSAPGREPAWPLIHHIGSTSTAYRRILAIPWAHSYYLDNTDLIRYSALSPAENSNPLEVLQQAGFTHVWLNQWAVDELKTLGSDLPEWVSALLESPQLWLEFADKVSEQYLFRIEYERGPMERSKALPYSLRYRFGPM